jgi:hypothetical protein
LSASSASPCGLPRGRRTVRRDAHGRPTAQALRRSGRSVRAQKAVLDRTHSRVTVPFATQRPGQRARKARRSVWQQPCARGPAKGLTVQDVVSCSSTWFSPGSTESSASATSQSSVARLEFPVASDGSPSSHSPCKHSPPRPLTPCPGTCRQFSYDFVPASLKSFRRAFLLSSLPAQKSRVLRVCRDRFDRRSFLCHKRPTQFPVKFPVSFGARREKKPEPGRSHPPLRFGSSPTAANLTPVH